MDPFKPKTRPEDIIVKRIRDFLRLRKWYTIKLHGNIYQSGMPDLFTAHRMYGSRWIEVKTERGRLEASQVENFHLMAAAGVGIHVLTDINEEIYQQLLTKPPNWWTYTK